MSLNVVVIKLTLKKHKKTGTFFKGNVHKFPFCPPKNYKPKKQTTWNTTHLHGFALSIGKFEYDKIFDAFYDKNLMNAKIFVKDLEEGDFVSRLHGQNVENLDDYGCPKIQDIIVAAEVRNVSWICSSKPF